MKTSFFTIAILAIAIAGCQKIVEHKCVCRNFDGQVVETDTHYGSADNALDLCMQREAMLNQERPGEEIYNCSLE